MDMTEEEEVAMGVNGKRNNLIPIESEEKARQVVEDNAKLVFANMERDESSNVDNETQFVLQPTKEGYLIDTTSELSSELTFQRWYCIPYFVDRNWGSAKFNYQVIVETSFKMWLECLESSQIESAKKS